MSGHCRSTTAGVEWFLLLRMRRPRPGGDKQHLWPGTQILYSVHTAQEPNDRLPQEQSFEGLKILESDLLQSARSGRLVVQHHADRPIPERLLGAVDDAALSMIYYSDLEF